MKSLLSDKVVLKKITCVKIINKEKTIREVLNTFFSNIVSNPNFREYNCDPLANKINI